MEPKPIVELHTFLGYPTDDQFTDFIFFFSEIIVVCAV